MPPELLNDPLDEAIYSPFLDRNHLMFLNGLHDMTIKDVRAGDEVLDNYLAHLTLKNWETGIADFRAMCKFERVGTVSAYEKSKQEDLDLPNLAYSFE
jgi:hypothetical protein